MKAEYKQELLEKYARKIKGVTASRSIKMELFYYKDWTDCGIDFCDRFGKWGVLTVYDLEDLGRVTPWQPFRPLELNVEPGFRRAKPLDMIARLSEQGLDIRPNRDLAPSKRQLALNFSEARS